MTRRSMTAVVCAALLACGAMWAMGPASHAVASGPSASSKVLAAPAHSDAPAAPAIETAAAWQVSWGVPLGLAASIVAAAVVLLLVARLALQSCASFDAAASWRARRRRSPPRLICT